MKGRVLMAAGAGPRGPIKFLTEEEKHIMPKVKKQNLLRNISYLNP